jgi:hypothetical protein
MMPPASVLTTASQPHQAGHYGGLLFSHCCVCTLMTTCLWHA